MRRELAPLYMLLATLCSSFTPFVVVSFDADVSPFWFGAFYRLGCGGGALLLLCAADFRLRLTRRVWRLVLARCGPGRLVCLGAPCGMWTAFALATRYVDPALAAVANALWPVAFIVLAQRLLRDEGRYRPATAAQFCLVGVCFAGFALAVIGGAGGVAVVGSGGFVLGLALALLSAVLTAGLAYNFSWATELRDAAVPLLPSGFSPRRAEFCFLFAAYLVGSVVAGLGSGALALVAEPWPGAGGIGWHSLLWAALLGGLTVDALATVCNRLANVLADRLTVNAVGYLQPLLTLAWLYLFGGAAAAAPLWVFAGALLIALGNLLLQTDAFQRCARLVTRL